MDLTWLGSNTDAAASKLATSLVPGLKASGTTKQSGVKANDTATSTTSASDSGNTITSDDFLTLLVTEMQNQDPTQPTDPNEYIQQLVGVNSLQQLISINGELGTAVGTTTPTTGGVQATSGI